MESPVLLQYKIWGIRNKTGSFSLRKFWRAWKANLRIQSLGSAVWTEQDHYCSTIFVEQAEEENLQMCDYVIKRDKLSSKLETCLDPEL